MPVDPAPASPGLMASLSGWKTTAVALATATVLSLPATDAQALAMGRLNVLSALGEPLQAEIEIPQITPEEANSLRTELASPEAFRAAGLDYNSALIGMQLTLQVRSGGRSVIRISSNRPVNDPFVDLILQLTWSSGRIIRDYTILLDPPAMRQGNSAANNTPAQTPSPASASAQAPQRSTAPRASGPQPAARAPAPRPTETPRPIARATPAPVVRAKPATPAAAAAGESDKQVTVKQGDTASHIASAAKPASISLDQMLVALLRSNPDAFIQNNVNRMKAGAVLDIPSANQAATTPAAEASQIISAQARDFDAFRRALAGNAPSVKTTDASRSASGRVQTQVDEKKPSSNTPDKLTLSKGGIQGQNTEEQIARENAARDAADRVAELSKNISELNKLGGASAPAGAEVPAATASTPAEPTAGTTPAVTASAAPVASAPEAPVVPALPPAAEAAPESSWLDSLTQNPILPAAGGALLALLAALGIYRSRQRKKAANLDSRFLESKISSDSFFGSSGGQQVDTSTEEGEGPASSLSYSPNRVDAASDVDPVAEADVYLAYGRDLQAEEILREALRNNPERIAIHAKLLDIYAKRRDTAAFAGQAAHAHDLTNGQGHEWSRIAEIGRQLDPANPLYSTEPHGNNAQPDAMADIPLSFPATSTEAEPLASGSLQTDAQPEPVATPASAPNALDFDLDLALDLDLGTPPAAADIPAKAASLVDKEEEPTISLDLGSPETPAPMPDPALPVTENSSALTVPAALEIPPSAPEASPLDFDLNLDIDLSPPSDVPPPSSPDEEELPAPDAKLPHAPVDSDMIEFDLNSLSLDLDDSAPTVDSPAPAPTSNPQAPPAAAPVAEPQVEEEELDTSDPLATKLALAEEFHSIGDEDGARALAEEVLEEATGSLRAKAERFLAGMV